MTARRQRPDWIVYCGPSSRASWDWHDGFNLAHDVKQIAAIRTLVKQGMDLVIATRLDMLSMRTDMRTMLQSQRRTEKNLADLIAALGRSTNGKH
jgi:hypothetical protein